MQKKLDYRHICFSLQLAAVALYTSINAVPADASPLLEEEQCTVFVCLLFYRQHPRFFHRSCVDCMFSAYDYPIYIRQVEFSQILHQRLTRQEPYRSRQLAQAVDSVFHIACFYRHAKPNICGYRPCCKIFCHPLGPFRENLICVPRCRSDNIHHFVDKFKRHVLVKKVAHRADENNCRLCSLSRFAERIFM